MTPDGRPRVLFLCTGNSCRSQMAEGFARAAYGDRLDACSAGTRPPGLNRLAVRAMAEVGIDLTTHANSTIDDCDPQTIDLVITVCGHAHETCPVFPGRTPVVHRGFDDPPALAAAAGATSDEDAMPHFRRVRDEIRAAVEALPALLRAHVIPTRGVTP